ncbi:L-serine ammonia-lyase, iron-sulfur-dependent, subunit alpha [Psychrilyobacter atlanticus]|uniref:L-serine ammonia-lyase, iron-sulfur-dependent, subunit alpha n=1 Tax=Psychrilyobacter atlanticus TaxID=271091 RepID=UPI0004284B09|nr:L-serine ammonia-lyase, iron-sulfur-dependent, subunit alpha [Psychrilyobacter atlanticus]
MDSLKELFKIGNGPSSSHTMGPERAAKRFKMENPDAASFKVELYGSLAATGKGHLTDWVIEETLKPKATEIVWMADFVHEFHTNGMKFIAVDKDGNDTKEWLVFSVGGGTIVEDGESRGGSNRIYPLTTMDEVIKWCKENQKELWEYVAEMEDSSIWAFLERTWEAMEDSVKTGLSKTGVLPGTIKYPRKAQMFYRKARRDDSRTSYLGKIFAYTLAVSEENGGGGRVVTAPTCGAAGIIPGLLYALKEEHNLSKEETLRGLAIAGLIGNLIKENATISGAEGGCQAEVGAGCAMAAGMAAFILGGSLDQIEYAAEMALEHHLGLTCDPVGGYVQIPCIERNAAASVRALDAANYALFTDGQHTVSFDKVVLTMKQTGLDMKSEYKETSLGGLAKFDFNANC